MSTTRDRRRDNEEEDERRRRISREIVRVESEVDDDSEEDEEDDEDDDKKRTTPRRASSKRTKREEHDEAEEEDIDEEEDLDEDEEVDDEEVDDEGSKEQRSKSLWQHITTGGFIAGDNASHYYRYLIAIALMCFVSIFLTFMSLNADDEYRRKEKRVAVLRERSVLKSEERYRISSREEVVKRLDREFGIKMIEQKNSQRM